MFDTPEARDRWRTGTSDDDLKACGSKGAAPAVREIVFGAINPGTNPAS
jgi:hypothetical protein